MAEQAINTIYLLGEQPDQLCGQIIKNLTTKVFSNTSDGRDGTPAGDDADEPRAPMTPVRTLDMSAPTPFKMTRSESVDSVKEDSMGSFPLAQLVFVVGHVAMKHIVYLELVEREFKRRKDEKAKGQSFVSEVDDTLTYRESCVKARRERWKRSRRRCRKCGRRHR